MHTQVSLSSIGQLVNGTHENPSSLLGPHNVDYRGESVMAVRSFLLLCLLIERQGRTSGSELCVLYQSGA